MEVQSEYLVYQVVLSLELRWAPEEDIAMSVDCGEEEWRRLHDIRLNGQVWLINS